MQKKTNFSSQKLKNSKLDSPSTIQQFNNSTLYQTHSLIQTKTSHSAVSSAELARAPLAGAHEPHRSSTSPGLPCLGRRPGSASASARLHPYAMPPAFASVPGSCPAFPQPGCVALRCPPSDHRVRICSPGP